MKGLLDSPIAERKCPSCGGAMEGLPGKWALQQWAPPAQPIALPPGTVFVCGLHRCHSCRHIELVDSE